MYVHIYIDVACVYMSRMFFSNRKLFQDYNQKDIFLLPERPNKVEEN